MLLLFFLRGGDGIAETLTLSHGKAMRNALLYFISHGVICLIHS